MKEFKEIIRKKGIMKTACYTTLILIMLLPLLIFQNQVVGSFKGTCSATTIGELRKCKNEGRYTEIKTNNIYDAGYNYVVDGKTVGKFLDVDLDGFVILTLADVATADELLTQSGEKTISGHYSSFKNKIFKETLEKVEADYIERFTNEAEIITEDQTKAMFFESLFNQYDGEGFPYIIFVIIIGIIILLLIFKMAEGLKMILKPEKTLVYGKKALEKEENVEKASFELQNGPYLFQNKNVRITNNYIFNLRKYEFNYHKINEAVWVYEKGIRKYGLVETGKQLIIKFKDHITFALPLTLSERKKVIEILRVKNPKIIKGYDQITERKYQEDSEHMN